MPILWSTTTTAQKIMDATAQDVRQTLSSAAGTLPDTTILLDYVWRVSGEMLRASKFKFLLSAPQRFVTQLGITDYWIGPNQTGPVTAYDTLLNLTDLRIIAPKSVMDRSNFRVLGHVDEGPLSARQSFSDTTSRPARPSSWRQDESSPNVLNIYPAPDNQNTYTPQPPSPIVTYQIAGSLPNRVYFLATTYVDSSGNESTSSPPAIIVVPANSIVNIPPPQEPISAGTSGVKYNRYNVYASSAPEDIILGLPDLTLQTTGTLLSTATTWIEPVTGLTTTGVPPPTVNDVEPIRGYVIEFRYFKQRVPVIDPTQILQIPDDYRDIVIAGVNALTFAYLTRPTEAARWYALFKDGIMQIVRDINFMARGVEYIQPDPSSIGNYLPTVEVMDLSLLIP